MTPVIIDHRQGRRLLETAWSMSLMMMRTARRRFPWRGEVTFVRDADWEGQTAASVKEPLEVVYATDGDTFDATFLLASSRGAAAGACECLDLPPLRHLSTNILSDERARIAVNLDLDELHLELDVAIARIRLKPHLTRSFFEGAGLPL